MFILKNRILYLLILLLLGINLLKNIYIENKIKSDIKYYIDNNINSINCKGFIDIECTINSLKILTNGYKIDIDNIQIYNLNILNGKDFFRNNIKTNFKNIRINNLFNILSKSTNLQINLQKNNLNLIFEHQDLNITLNLIFGNRENLFAKKEFNSFSVYINSKNDVVKEIIYELYKLKFLEKRDKDGIELSRGINRSLGVDTENVIPKKIFLEEPYLIVSMLLISEIEILDIVMDYNDDENISNFLKDVLHKNGVSKLKIKKRTNHE